MRKLLLLFVAVALLWPCSADAQYRPKAWMDSTSIEQSAIHWDHFGTDQLTEIKPLVAICYDDGNYCVWESVYWHMHHVDAPLRAYGKAKGLGTMPATIAVVGRYLRADTDTTAVNCKMNLAQITALRNAGWEVAAHGWNQGCSGVNDWDDSLPLFHGKASASDFVAQVEPMWCLMADTLGWRDTETWVYPNGFFSALYEQVVGRRFRYGIVVGNTEITRRHATIGMIVADARGRYVSRGPLGYSAVYDPLAVPRANNARAWSALYRDIHDLIDAHSGGVIIMAHSPCSTEVCTGETPEDLWGNGYPAGWQSMVALLDTLWADDLIEMVTVKELLRRTSAVPIASCANWIDGRMKDADADGKPNGWGQGYGADFVHASGPANRHHVGWNTIRSTRSSAETVSDTVGIHGGDVWGISRYSSGTGCGMALRPIACEGVEPGDVDKAGAYFCILDSVYFHNAGVADTSIYDVADVEVQIQITGYEREILDENETATNEGCIHSEETAHTKVKINDASRTYVFAPDSTTTWLHLWIQKRVGERGHNTSAYVFSDAFALKIDVDFNTNNPDSVYNRIGISYPYFHVKKRAGVKW